MAQAFEFIHILHSYDTIAQLTSTHWIFGRGTVVSAAVDGKDEAKHERKKEK